MPRTIRNVTVQFLDGSSIQAGASTQNSPGEFTFYPDDVCKVDPPNPRKIKHRGRICRLTGSYRSYRDIANKPSALKIGVKFLDTGQFGYVDAADLIPALPEEIAAQPYQN